MVEGWNLNSFSVSESLLRMQSVLRTLFSYIKKLNVHNGICMLHICAQCNMMLSCS